MRTLILSALALAVSAPGLAQSADIVPETHTKMKDGQWRFRLETHMAMDVGDGWVAEDPLMDDSDECFEGEDASLDPAELSGDDCSVSDVTYSPYGMNFQLTCVNEVMTMSGPGEINWISHKDQFAGLIHMTAEVAGIKVKGDINIMAHRLGECNG